MSEKKKNMAQAVSKWRFIVYLARIILALPLLCGAFIGIINAYDYVQMRLCFDEAEPIERNDLIDYEAELENPVITQANLSELSLLPYYPDVRAFPLPPYSSSISHPDVDYFLTSHESRLMSIYAKPELVLCQSNGWASHVLSFNVHNYRFSPDGKYFAFLAWEYIEIYDAKTVELLHEVRIPRKSIVTPAIIFVFHPTEPLIAILVDEADPETFSLYFWNYESQEAPIEVFTGDGVFGQFDFFKFNEEGTLLVAHRRGTETATFVWGIPPA